MQRSRPIELAIGAAVVKGRGLVEAAQPWGAPPPVQVLESWYLSLNGQQSPPLQLAQVHQSIQNGQLNAAQMVWKTGLPSWVPAGQSRDALEIKYVCLR